MTLIEAIRAYDACLQLKDEKTDMQTAFGLAGLTRRLEEHARFYAGKEMEILTDCGQLEEGKPVITEGRVKLRKPEEYARRMQELNEVEIETIQPVKLHFEAITAAQVMALGELVQW